MPAATAQAISLPFAVATGSGAGVLSLLSWRAVRGSPIARVVAALAVVMGVATVYHALLLVAPEATETTLLGGSKYLAVVGALGLAANAHRRTPIPLGNYEPAPLAVVAGVTAFVGGGLLAELFAPVLVHWAHGFGALLVVVGFYSLATTDPSLEGRLDAAIRETGSTRPREDWMRPIDDRILETYAASGLVLTPAVVAYNIGHSREEVNRRLSELERRSFVERVERGKYRLADRGRVYLSGVP